MRRAILAVALLCLSATAFGQVTIPSPIVPQQFFDNSGAPCAGCFLYTYSAGTSTPLATYTDSTGTSQNTVPITLDSAGRASIWLGNNSYKFVLQDANNVTLWTQDNVNLFLLLSRNNTWTGTQTFNGAVTFASTVSGITSLVATSVNNVQYVKCTNTVADTTNINTAFAALGSPALGKIVLTAGTSDVCRITATLNFNLGYPSAPSDSTSAGNFEFDAIAAMRADAGIGAAVHISYGYYPVLKLKFDGGGQCGTFASNHCNDQALQMDHVTGSIVQMQAKDYAGTAYYSFGAANTGSSVSWMNIIGINVGQLLDIESSTGIGVVSSNENGAVHGSVVNASSDMNWMHQSSGNTDAGCVATVNGGTSNHLNVQTTGYTNTTSQLCVSGGAALTTLYEGHFVGDGSHTTNGLKVSGASTLAASHITCDGVGNNCVLNDCSHITVTSLYSAYAPLVHHYTQQCSTTGEADGQIRFAEGTSASSAEGIRIESNATSGHLTITGQLSGDNTGAAAAADVNNLSAGTYLYIVGFQSASPANPFTTGSVLVADRSKFSLSGALLTAYAWATGPSQLTSTALQNYPANALTLENSTWESPGTIGSTTPNSAVVTTLKVGGGATIQNIFTGSGTLTYGSIAAQSCADQPLTVTGASAGEACLASPGAGIGANLGFGGCYTSGSNTVSVRVCNPTSGPLTPSAVSWTAWVLH